MKIVCLTSYNNQGYIRIYVGPTGKDLLQQLDFRNSSNGNCNLILPFRENGQARPARSSSDELEEPSRGKNKSNLANMLYFHSTLLKLFVKSLVQFTDSWRTIQHLVYSAKWRIQWLKLCIFHSPSSELLLSSYPVS